jgi:predicted PurR-regulated permease PerM
MSDDVRGDAGNQPIHHDDTAAANDAGRVPPPGSLEVKSLLSLAVAAVVIATLFVGQDVLIPIILAVMLSFVLSPVVDALGRIGLSRAPSVVLTVLLTFGVIVLAGTLIAGQASVLAADAPRYANTIEQKLEGVQLFAASRLTSLTRLFGTAAAPPPAASTQPRTASGRAAAPLRPSAPGAPTPPVLVEIARTETSPLLVARAILAPVLGPLETTVIVLVIAIFILMQREDLRDRFIRLAGSNDLHRTTLAMDDAGQRLSRYFLSQLAVNTTFGLVVGLGLWAIGIPSPALWAVLAGLLRFVPYIGAILAAVAPIALGAAIDPGWRTAIEVALLFIIVEPVTGYVVEPLLYGHSTGLSPVSVIVAAVFWTWIWGPIGLILSTPLTLCLVVMGRHVKSLEFFDVLLGDRPALAPVDNFYQRIIADNPDEALEKAETLLADRPLLDYYDTVVLAGLKRAAQDEARGMITRERARELTRSMMQVIDDLSDHVDTGSTAPKAAGTLVPPVAHGVVACVSGRGPFDDAVAAMLAQLLARRGVKTERIPHGAVSRDRIADLDLAGVPVITLSYLDLRGSPAHLKYLLRRLRQHAPHATIVVALWPAGAEPTADAADRQAVGADVYVGSLREAVDASITAAARAHDAAPPIAGSVS